MARNAELVLQGTRGERTVPLDGFYSLPADRPHVETVLTPGEIIVEVRVPPAGTRRSHYLKVRDRASFEWALASCAVSADLDGEFVSDARIVAGGVATIPWRLRQVEEALVGQPLTAEAIDGAAARATEGAQDPHPNGSNTPPLRRPGA